jgi:hypothetical protein
MTYHCGYCEGKCKHSRKPRKRVPRSFPTWNDLVDHLINVHRFRMVNNKLVRR